MDELGLGSEPTGNEISQEIAPATEQGDSTPDARTAILSRLEAGEPLTVELYSEYQIAAEQVASDTEGDFSLLQMGVSLECAELFVRANMLDQAVGAMRDLVDEITNQAEAPKKYDPFVAKVRSRIAELESEEPKS